MNKRFCASNEIIKSKYLHEKLFLQMFLGNTWMLNTSLQELVILQVKVNVKQGISKNTKLNVLIYKMYLQLPVSIHDRKERQISPHTSNFIVTVIKYHSDKHNVSFLTLFLLYCLFKRAGLNWGTSIFQSFVTMVTHKMTKMTESDLPTNKKGNIFYTLTKQNQV